MNELETTESSASEFVEVDPTGRYGRVTILLYPLSFFLSVLVSGLSFVIFLVVAVQ